MPQVLKKNNGFSIVGVLVAAGMMGGLALFLANLARQQHVVQKKSETGAELVELHHKIVAVLYDSDACLATLGEGNTLSSGPLAKLVNKGNKTILATGDEINRALKITEMEIQNITNAGPSTKAAEIKVSIEKLGVANAGATTEKVFKLTVELDSAGKISRCHHTLDSKEHGIKTRMCTEMGGEMVCSNGSPPTMTGGVSTCPGGGSNTTRCSIVNLFEKNCTDMGGVWDYLDKKCSISNLFQPVWSQIVTIQNQYVPLSGGSMGGPLSCVDLHCTGKITAGGDITGANIVSLGDVTASGDMSAANVDASGKVTAGGPAPQVQQPSCPTGTGGTYPNCAVSCPAGSSDTPTCRKLISRGGGGSGKSAWFTVRYAFQHPQDTNKLCHVGCSKGYDSDCGWCRSGRRRPHSAVDVDRTTFNAEAGSLPTSGAAVKVCPLSGGCTWVGERSNRYPNNPLF